MSRRLLPASFAGSLPVSFRPFGAISSAHRDLDH